MLISCQIDGNRQVDRDRFTFNTGDDTEIFFKNVRQSYYDLEENKAAQINVFRFSDRLITEDQPVINLAIVHQYVNDKAFILVERNEWFDDQTGPLQLESTLKNGTITEIDLETMNKDAMLEFATRVYEDLQQGAEFKLIQKGERIPIFTDKKEREAIRITLSDYYRLTRIFQ